MNETVRKKVLLVNGGSGSFAERFVRACEERSYECVKIRTHSRTLFHIENGTVHYIHRDEEIDIASFDYAFIRVTGKNKHSATLLAHMLDYYGVPYNDATANREHTMGDEKITQMVKFGLHAVPTPKTLLFSKLSYLYNKKTLEKEISFPCVLKTDGSQGRNVWKVSSFADIEERMAMSPKGILFMVQELVENKYDIRALFFKDELLGAMERHATDGFHNNAAQGGTLFPAALTSNELMLCRKVMQVAELDFGGVDLVRTESGVLFFEVNKGPQVYGLESVTGLNIPELLVERIFTTQ